MTRHSAFASSHTFHRGACSSVGTKSTFSLKRGVAVEQDGEKEKKVQEGVEKREMTEVKVADSGVAPVCDLSLKRIMYPRRFADASRTFVHRR